MAGTTKNAAPLAGGDAGGARAQRKARLHVKGSVAAKSKVDSLTGKAAVEYVRHGWALCEIPKGKKNPEGLGATGWNERDKAIVTEERAARIPDGVGLCHKWSGTCVLDLDNLPAARAWLAERGIDVDALLNAPTAVRIMSGRPGRAKLLYRLPPGVDSLLTHQVAPCTDKDGKKAKALEFRCAARTGNSVQDALPPTTHPKTGDPYYWEYGDDLVGDWRCAPVIPADVLALWQSLGAAERERNSTLSTSAGEPHGLLGDDIRQMFSYITENSERDYWLNAIWGNRRAFHAAWAFPDESAWLAIADEYSQGASNYEGIEDVEKKWLEADDREGPGIGFLWNEAIKGGFAPTDEQKARLHSTGPVEDDFDDISDQTEGGPDEPDKPLRFLPVPAHEFASGKPPAWLVRGVIPEAELAVIYGESGSGKTFFVLDLVAAVARGVDWRERKVTQGRVVYVCAEGIGGFRQRLKAYAHQAGIRLEDLPLAVIPDAPNMLERPQALDVCKAIAETGGAAVIVIDTLSAVTPGGNENSGEDVGKVIAHCKGLHRATGAVVILVHHSGKDATKGARGWSGLRAAADAELEVTRSFESRSVSVSKMKDGDDGAAFGFRLLPLIVGEDEDGHEQTSCIVEHCEAVPKQAKRRKFGSVEKMTYDVVVDLQPLSSSTGADMGDVLAGAVAKISYDPSKRDQRRKSVTRALDTLAADGFLRIEGGRVFVEQ